MPSSHVVDYKIYGDDLQFVEVELDPGETVIAEAGSMMYMHDGITFESKMGDGSSTKGGFFDKVWSAGKRAVTGESLFLTHFTHNGQGKSHVAFAGNYPGKIIAIDLDEVDGHLTCQKDAFLAAAMGTKVDVTFNKRLGSGFFGGEGFILQTLHGDGMVFIHAGGTIIEKRLENSKIRVDTGCIVAFEPSISYDIERAGNLKSMVFGGEGLFLATLQGTGRVWLQSLPFSRLADRVVGSARMNSSNSRSSGGESSVFGMLERLTDG